MDTTCTRIDVTVAASELLTHHFYPVAWFCLFEVIHVYLVFPLHHIIFVLQYLIDRSGSFSIDWLARKDIETCYALLFSCVKWGYHRGVLPAVRLAQGTHVAL